MTQLLLYDSARAAIAQARTVDEVRDWEDKAAAVREYARRAKNRDMEIDAAEIRVRAQRRRGELLAELRASGQLVQGKKKRSSADDQLPAVTLEELDTTKNESSHAQKLAKIEPEAFEELTARCRARLEQDEKLHAFDVLRERDGPINGGRSVMASRQEPDDSLDYFPTPPWATRALCEHVLPKLGVNIRDHVVHEPACGEGHISGVLEEYRPLALSATDIHDYSVDGISPPGWNGTRDFLDLDTAQFTGVDWIITNPPFEEKALRFILRALDIAAVGVAMFVQLRFVETIDRYEQLFRDRPPTQIAFFVERVNLCKGRWDPTGSTATAYQWMVWLKNRPPKPPMWIPPGRRDALTLPTDVDRFTAQPVGPMPVATIIPAAAEAAAPLPAMVPRPSGATPRPAAPDDGLDIPAFLRRNA